MTKAWFETIKCNMDWLRKHFNIKTSDILQRLGFSLIPFYPNFATLTEGSPDMYGPLWIYTTLIFVVGAAGSLSNFFADTKSVNFYQEFVPISAAIVKLFIILKF